MPVKLTYTREEALRMLSLTGDERQALFREADAARRRVFGDEVHIRGIVEFSNVCANDCLYCGIRLSNSKIARYSLDPEEVLDIARRMPISTR